MAINPYSYKDQHKTEWQNTQQQIAGHYTGGTRFDPKPGSTSPSWQLPTREPSFTSHIDASGGSWGAD